MVRNLLAAIISAATLAGCNISGVAEKGPFQEGSTVTATVLNSDASLNTALTYQTTVSDAAGSYQIASNVRSSAWFQLEASGNYFNELTNNGSDEPLTLNATKLAGGPFTTANINLYSHLVTARFQQRVADGLNLIRAYNRSERDLRNVFGVSRRSTVLSVADGRSRRRQDNANLALFSGAFLSLPDTAVALDNLTQDFADDGLFNGVGEVTFASIALKSAEAGLLTTIRDNLIANGATNPPDEADLGELPEWVDTEGEPPVEVNTAPVAAAATASGDEDTSIEIALSATDAEGDALTFTTAAAANGTVSVVGNIATYTPNANYFGADSFTFTVSDGEFSDSAQVGLDVASVDDLPTAEDINAGVVTVGESTSVLLIGADIDSDITFTASDGSLGTVAIDSSDELGVRAIYTTGRAVGEDSFEYQVTGDGQSVTATVSLVVEPEPVPQGEILGSVRDTNGNLIEGVTVDVLVFTPETDEFLDEILLDESDFSVENESLSEPESFTELEEYSVTTDANGQFVATSEVGSLRVLALRKAGYADQVVPVRFLEGSLPLNVVMIQRGLVQTVDATAGGTLTGSDGASVTINPNMFVDASGNAVTGDIDVTITPLDVSNKAILDAFPGDFYGTTEESFFYDTIATLGTTEFVFTQNGQPISVAPERIVDILLPIYNEVNPRTGLDVALGDSIALWSLNETTGDWLQEGEGTVVTSLASPTGFALAAQVSHFSWWNVDVVIETSFVDVQVNTPLLSDGTEILSDVATLHAVSNGDVSWRLSQIDSVLNVGESVELYSVPPNSNVCFWVEYAVNAGGTINSAQQCIDTQAFSGYSLTFDTTVDATALTLSLQDIQPSYEASKAVTPIRIVPTTVETSVDYLLEGDLPTGLSLVQVSSTSAEIQGVPTELGRFAVTVEGTDSEGNVTSVDYTVTVEELEVPEPGLLPVLQGTEIEDSGITSITLSRASYVYSGEAIEINLSQYNIGEAATDWSYDLFSPLLDVSITEDGDLSVSYINEPFDGLTVSESFTVRAINDNGNSGELKVNIEMSFFDCSGEYDISNEDAIYCLVQ